MHEEEVEIVEVIYPSQALPLEVHIGIFVVSFLVVIMAIGFLNKYRRRSSKNKETNNILCL